MTLQSRDLTGGVFGNPGSKDRYRMIDRGARFARKRYFYNFVKIDFL